MIWGRDVSSTTVAKFATLLVGSAAVLSQVAAGPVGHPIRQLLPRQSLSTPPNGTTSNNVTWDWTDSSRKLHGVALGNWLVLEEWMDQAWFHSVAGDEAEDEWTFSEVLGNRTTEVLTDHWNTWITEDDIRLISQSGFNTIRIPVGYWAFISEPAGTPYASQAGQVEQITRVLELAQRYGLYAIIDLHGLPGSQNGEQPSGHIGYNNFFQAQNQNYSDATVDAIIDYIVQSPYRSIISAFAACNEPVYYTNDQYETLVGFYERTYAKTAPLGIPLQFHPGNAQVNVFDLWQGFINGKDPKMLILEIHPYIGRLQPIAAPSTYIDSVCSRAESYADYGIPVAVTEWSISTAIWNNTSFDEDFYTAQVRGWGRSAGGIFWSWRVNAYTAQFNQTENFTLYSAVDLINLERIPLPASGQDSQDFIASLPDLCNFGNATETFASVVPSIQPTVTAAVTRQNKRSLTEPTPAPVL